MAQNLSTPPSILYDTWDIISCSLNDERTPPPRSPKNNKKSALSRKNKNKPDEHNNLNEDKINDSNTVVAPLYIKFVVAAESYCLLITDLTHVWLRKANENDIENERLKYAPSIKKQSTQATIKLLTSLIRDPTSEHKCFIKFSEDKSKEPEEPQDPPGDQEKHKLIQNNHNLAHNYKTTLTLVSRVVLDMVEFEWSFVCLNYGNFHDQATLIKNQLLLPLMDMVKALSYQVSHSQSLSHNPLGPGTPNSLSQGQQIQGLPSGSQSPSLNHQNNYHSHSPSLSPVNLHNQEINDPVNDNNYNHHNLAVVHNDAPSSLFDSNAFNHYSANYNFRKNSGQLYEAVVINQNKQNQIHQNHSISPKPLNHIQNTNNNTSTNNNNNQNNNNNNNNHNNGDSNNNNNNSVRDEGYVNSQGEYIEGRKEIERREQLEKQLQKAKTQTVKKRKAFV